MLPPPLGFTSALRVPELAVGSGLPAGAVARRAATRCPARGDGRRPGRGRALLYDRGRARDRAVVERAELTQAAGEMALRAGRLDAALELLERAATALTASGRERDAARIIGSIAAVLVRHGRNEEAAERIAASLQTLGSDRLDAEVGALNRALGHALVFAGRYEEATPAIETALKIAQALELPNSSARHSPTRRSFICRRAASRRRAACWRRRPRSPSGRTSRRSSAEPGPTAPTCGRSGIYRAAIGCSSRASPSRSVVAIATS